MNELLDRQRGCFLGLAIGDALGVPAEFKQVGEFEPITRFHGGGPFNLAPGEWTDDTSMALCVADAIIETGTIDPLDLHGRFWGWWQRGENSHNGRCFDIGNTTKDGLRRNKGKDVFDFPPDRPYEASNGSIMRLAPVPIRWVNDPETALKMASLQSRVTHGNRQVDECCIDLCREIISLMNGVPMDQVLPVGLRGIKSSEIPSSGYCVDTMMAAHWAMVNSDNFRDALLLAVNLGDDADTVGAVTGHLAGACYGRSGIPVEWLEQLVWQNRIDTAAVTLSGVPILL